MMEGYEKIILYGVSYEIGIDIKGERNWDVYWGVFDDEREEG